MSIVTKLLTWKCDGKGLPQFFFSLFFYLSLFYRFFFFPCFYYQCSYFFIFFFLYTGQATPLNFCTRTFLIVAVSFSSSSSCFRNSALLFINSSSCWNNSCSFCFLAARACFDATLFFNLRTVRLSRTSAMLILLASSNFTFFAGELVHSEEDGLSLQFSWSFHRIFWQTYNTFTTTACIIDTRCN